MAPRSEAAAARGNPKRLPWYLRTRAELNRSVEHCLSRAALLEAAGNAEESDAWFEDALRYEEAIRLQAG